MVSGQVNPIQYSLGLMLRDDATLANFYSGPNGQVLELISRLPERPGALVYLWGPLGSGRSHLLQAACVDFQQRGRSAIYLPLAELVNMAPQGLESLDDCELLCLDDLQAVAGNRAWEEALFHLFNRRRQCGGALLVAASVPPRGLALQLADLQSRLMLAAVYQLRALADEDKLHALQLRAKARGMGLSDEAGSFILSHGPRSMDALLALLDTLDQASWRAQRKLTIPFLKQTLGW